MRKEPVLVVISPRKGILERFVGLKKTHEAVLLRELDTSLLDEIELFRLRPDMLPTEPPEAA